MAWTVYGPWLESQEDGNAINIDTGGVTLKVILLTSAYTPDATNHDFLDDVSANEVATGTAYTAGGPTVSSQAITRSGVTVTFDFADITISQDSGGGFTNARYAVLYYSTGTPGTSRLIIYEDFGSDKGNTGGDLVLQMDASGVFTKS